MKGRVHSSGTGISRSHPMIHRPWTRGSLGLLLLVLCAGSALGQTTTGHLPTDFGAVPLGTSVTRSVVTLTPVTDVVFDSLTVTGANSGDFTVAAGGCPTGSTITAGTSCAVSITFTPTAGGCRSAILRIASHDVTTNQTFTDVVGLIGSGVGPDLPGTIPLTLPFAARLQGTPTLTPIPGSTDSAVAVNPTIVQTRGGFNQLAVQGTLTPAVGSTPARSVGFASHRFVGVGDDTLLLCSVTTSVPGPTGLPVVEEIFYVASGTGIYAGATGTGRIVSTAGATGVLATEMNGTLTLRIPLGPFDWIYLTDVMRRY